MKLVDKLLIGCGNRGLRALWDLTQRGGEVMALEASSRVGGSSFLVSRAFAGDQKSPIFDWKRDLPPLRIWWDRQWCAPNEVNWEDRDWAFVLPQWNFYFKALREVQINSKRMTELLPKIKLESPVRELLRKDNQWQVRSGEDDFLAKTLYWSCGMKSFQDCFGKKASEIFLEANPHYLEPSRDADGVLVLQYEGAVGETQFLALPVRHQHKLYLSFVSLHEGQVECFCFFPADFLQQPKEVSFFEKSLKRTLKHCLAQSLPELRSSNLGIVYDTRAFVTASPWRLKDCPEMGLYFVDEMGPETLIGNVEATEISLDTHS